MSGDSGAPATPQGARLAVIVLTAMNLLNYIDRYVPSAVKDLYKKDLGLTDLQTSLPFSAFIVVYMLASPLFGGLADRRSRKVLIMAGVALWSLATAGAALATGFLSFLIARAMVGVGEARTRPSGRRCSATFILPTGATGSSPSSTSPSRSGPRWASR